MIIDNNIINIFHIAPISSDCNINDNIIANDINNNIANIAMIQPFVN